MGPLLRLGALVLSCPGSNHGSAASQLGDLKHVTLLLYTLVLIYKVREIIAPTRVVDVRIK